jgi:ketosteroid isomerase-like protein
MSHQAAFRHHADYPTQYPALQSDIVDIRRWMLDLAKFVNAVDYVGARSIFSEDMVTFGTFAKSFLIGREQTEKEQWRNVWSTIDDFKLLDDHMHVMVSPDRKVAVAAVPFISTGFAEDGATFERTGRATIVLSRSSVGEAWLAQHTHMSLDRDMAMRSFGQKSELRR